MKKHIAKMLAAAAMMWLGGSAAAQEPGTVVMNEQPAARGGWYASAGVLYLKQTGSRDLAYATNNYSGIDDAGATTLLSSSITEFDHEYRWSGRAEVGVKDASGFGLRARYFWYTDNNSISLIDDVGEQSTPNFPGVSYNEITGTKFLTANPVGTGFGTVGTAGAPSSFIADRSLTMRALDIDLTSDNRVGSLELTWSAGLRWMQIDQVYNAYENVLTPGTFEFPVVLPLSQSLTSSHSLDAWGPTVGLDARYPILSSFKGLVSGRFGILYAECHQQVSVVKSGDPNVFQPPVAPISGAQSNRRLGMPFGELELGGEYSRTLGCDGPEIFVRGTVLSSSYWGAGTSARVNVNNNPGNEDLIFFGFSASVGIRY